ncbi:MAG: hypothetical protein ACI91Q_001385 [Gammaproteobacteria bacterium]|jgi:hypothetical protein
MTRRYILLAAASIALLAACSGNDGQVRVSGPDPVTAPSITSAPDTTQPEPDPTSPATTESLVAADPSPAPTSTTGPTPTTPLGPIAEIEAAVKQARLDLEDAYFAAASDPSNQELREEFRTFYSSEAFVPLEDFLDELLADGTALRMSSDVPKSITFPGEFELLRPTEARLRICRVDSDVVRIQAADGGAEVIVDDRVVATLTDVLLALVGERWIVTGGDRLMQWQERDSCDF